MLDRILEPEVMDTEAEARDYDAMDHRDVNERFVADLLEALGDKARATQVLDVGTGTAQVPIALCRRLDGARVTAIDLSSWMIELGRQNVLAAGLEDRIRIERVDAKAMPFATGSFDLVISNSIVHHIPDPETVLREMIRVTSPDGVLFVRDLLRPRDEATVNELVETYAADANKHQRSLFDASLRAALTVAEMQELVAKLGCDGEEVRQTTDRHWTWVGRQNVPGM